MKFMMDTTTFSKEQQNGETTNDADTFQEKIYKASGGSEDKLFKYECALTDEELDRAIQLKKIARLNTIAHILIFLLFYETVSSFV